MIKRERFDEINRSSWGTAEIHVISSHSLTFISKHNQIGVCSIIFEPIITHPNHTVGTKCFQ
nr:hypothetical protein [Bacillus thuringiensis]